MRNFYFDSEFFWSSNSAIPLFRSFLPQKKLNLPQAWFLLMAIPLPLQSPFSNRSWGWRDASAQRVELFCAAPNCQGGSRWSTDSEAPPLPRSGLAENISISQSLFFFLRGMKFNLFMFDVMDTGLIGEMTETRSWGVRLALGSWAVGRTSRRKIQGKLLNFRNQLPIW